MTIGRVGHHPRRFGYSYRQNEKKKINRRQSKKPPSLRLRGLKKKNKPKAKHDRARLRLRGKKNKPKVKHDRARLRLRGKKKNKPKAEQETAQPTAARF